MGVDVEKEEDDEGGNGPGVRGAEVGHGGFGAIWGGDYGCRLAGDAMGLGESCVLFVGLEVRLGVGRGEDFLRKGWRTLITYRDEGVLVGGGSSR